MFNDNDSKTFLELMIQCVELYKEFITLESIKMENISQNKYKTLDEYVKKEEALLLEARGLEKKRENILIKYNLQDKKMNEIIFLFNEPYLNQIEKKFNELSNIIIDLKHINQNCNSMTQIRLHKINETLNKLKNEKLRDNSPIKVIGKKSEKLSQKV